MTDVNIPFRKPNQTQTHIFIPGHSQLRAVQRVRGFEWINLVSIKVDQSSGRLISLGEGGTFQVIDLTPGQATVKKNVAGMSNE